MAIYMTFLEYEQNLWEASKPTIVLTDNKSLTPFFSTIFVEGMRLCDAVQNQRSTYHCFSQHSSWPSHQIKIETHGEEPSQNPGRWTDNTNWGHNVLPRCRRQKKLFFIQESDEDETEEQIRKRKGQTGKKTTEWVAQDEPSSMKPSIKVFTNIRVEQDVDLVLKNIKLELFGQPHDEDALTTDRRLKH